MRRLKAFILISLGCIALGCKDDPPPPVEIVGGFDEISIDDEAVVAAANIAVAQKNELLANDLPMEGEPEPGFTLGRIISAEIQVVAGKNYKMVLELVVDGQPKKAIAVVYRNLAGKLKLSVWEWRDPIDPLPAETSHTP